MEKSRLDINTSLRMDIVPLNRELLKWTECPKKKDLRSWWAIIKIIWLLILFAIFSFKIDAHLTSVFFLDMSILFSIRNKFFKIVICQGCEFFWN